MAPILVILISFAVGISLGKWGGFKESAPDVLNSVVLNLCLPAVVLLQIHELRVERGVLDAAILLPVAMPWIVFGAATLFFGWVGRSRGWSREKVGALVLTAGLGNTSFVGFPLIEAFYGKEGLGPAVVCDQLGSFLVLSTVGLAYALRASRGSGKSKGHYVRILVFPPFLALIAAFASRGVQYPGFVVGALERLGNPLAPLALAAVGMRLGLAGDARLTRGSGLGWGLGFKLAIVPAGIFAFYAGVLGARGLPLQVSVAEAAMAPMITGAVIAVSHGLEPALANRMLAVGIPLSFLTVPFWVWITRGFV